MSRAWVGKRASRDGMAVGWITRSSTNQADPQVAQVITNPS